MQQLVVWGSNNYRQLSSKNQLHLYAPSVNSDFESHAPARVATGDGHTLVLTDYGDVFAFGRGTEGQLGVGEKANKCDPVLVSALSHEIVTEIACGSMTSYAVTNSGKLYQWGLVHSRSRLPTSNSTTGALSGMVQEGVDVMVDVDAEARSQAEAYISDRAPRHLRDIVRDSTERWLISDDGTDEQYERELTAMGLSQVEIRNLQEKRGRDCQELLRLGCVRITQPLPRLVPSAIPLVVRMISAGFGHCMIVTEDGNLYSSGYNDRGQLGLGHRINTSDFRWVDYLAPYFVVQVCCGQQHTICRARQRRNNSLIEEKRRGELRGLLEAEDNAEEDEHFVDSTVGCEVFCWGNGILGQLGLGRRGTTKGRLLPTRIPRLCENFPNGIIHVGAGHNFTVAVTHRGEVYSWGHAEYNQHGTGANAATDYTDPFHFFEPQHVPIFRQEDKKKWVRGREIKPDPQSNSDAEPARIVRVTCGSNFTIATDENGHLYSWGWNESGVLGHGIGYFSSSPSRIQNGPLIGEISTPVLQVVAGAKHVLALIAGIGERAGGANHLRYLLEDEKWRDMSIAIDGDNPGTTTYIPCHKFVLAARSSYFRGIIATAETERSEWMSVYSKTLDAKKEVERLTVDLTGLSFATCGTVRALLDYIYLDRCTIPSQKRSQLLELATYLCLFSLATHVEIQLQNANNQTRSALIAQLNSSTNSEENGPTGRMRAVLPPSSFADDMSCCINDPRFADVLFAFTDSFSVYAHKAILCQISYFNGLFSGAFRESRSSETAEAVQCIRLEGFVEDGIDLVTFVRLLLFSYTGYTEASNPSVKAVLDLAAAAQDRIHYSPEQNESQSCKCLQGFKSAGIEGEESQESDNRDDDDDETEMSDTMSLLVVANRLGYSRLELVCEKDLTLHLRDVFPTNAENCLRFSKVFGFSRLERKCLEVLRLGNATK